MATPKELQDFIESTKGMSHTTRITKWFKKNLGKKVTSKELAQIPGKSGNPISHNIRRVFELRDEQGYNIVNHKDNASSGRKLKIDEWVLLSPDPNPKKIRSRGVNKRIMFEVFSRDNKTCKFCGRGLDDDDPFNPGHKIKLHVGHIVAHKRKKDGEYLKVEPIQEISSSSLLTKEDFISMCNVCNEGAKNNDLKIMSFEEQVLNSDKNTKKSIYDKLKKEFN
jgi:hypothetical protein